jgi:hypothetical protein
MAKAVDNLVLDAALNVIKSTADRRVLCSGQPANYAGVAAVTLADVAVASGDFTGPADGTTSGRKITVAAKTAIPVDSAGTVTHEALVDDGGSVLLYVTTTASTAVAAAGTVDAGSWVIEIADPT